MKKTAVLLDLGFVLRKLRDVLGRYPTAIEIHEFARRSIAADEELFRIYCYHCPPYDGIETHPITRTAINFAGTPIHRAMTQFIKNLKLTDNVAFRSGEMSFDGWLIKKQAARDIIRTRRPLKPDDFAPDLNQKGIDVKIGLDVAWLASKSIVERIILVAADSDFIPAMKFARRKGVQVVLVTLGHAQTKRELKEHADELRTVTYP